jgi:hypothetical protein
MDSSKTNNMERLEYLSLVLYRIGVNIVIGKDRISGMIVIHRYNFSNLYAKAPKEVFSGPERAAIEFLLDMILFTYLTSN